MSEFLQVLPFALASAVSPLLFTFALLVASQKNKSLLKSLLFLLGSAIAIGIIGFFIFFLLAKLSPSTTYTTGDAQLDLIIGFALVLFALHQIFIKKPKKEKSKRDIPLLGAFSLGFGFMMVNSSTIIMYLPAAHIASYYPDSVKVGLLVVMIFFSLIPAIAPPLMLRLIPSQQAIDSITTFVNQKGRYIIAAVFGILGTIEIIKAVKFLY